VLESMGTVEKPTSDELDAVLTRLTVEQIRFVIARQNCATDKDAAEQIGIRPRTTYSWDNKDEVNEAVRLMAVDGVATALHLRRRHLAEAMAVKIQGLRSKNERTRQAVATELIEWELGRATQKQEVSGPDGEALKAYVTVSPDDWPGDGK